MRRAPFIAGLALLSFTAACGGSSDSTGPGSDTVKTDNSLVVLTDDKHLQNSDNIVAVVRKDVDEPALEDAVTRARELSERVYVVDLAWLRSTPWRERVAATFDPEHLRQDLWSISSVRIRHHPDSAASAVLLVGWLASRLGWKLDTLSDGDGTLTGTAKGSGQDIEITLEQDRDLQVRGLNGLVLETAGGRHLQLDRGPGGLHAKYKNARGDEREWTVLGASRGESGILGEGIRQALLREPTYSAALSAGSKLIS
jgi:hypothetical protein